jgi:hypothetical protein
MRQLPPVTLGVPCHVFRGSPLLASAVHRSVASNRRCRVSEILDALLASAVHKSVAHPLDPHRLKDYVWEEPLYPKKRQTTEISARVS